VVSWFIVSGAAVCFGETLWGRFGAVEPIGVQHALLAGTVQCGFSVREFFGVRVISGILPRHLRFHLVEQPRQVFVERADPVRCRSGQIVLLEGIFGQVVEQVAAGLVVVEPDQLPVALDQDGIRSREPE